MISAIVVAAFAAAKILFPSFDVSEESYFSNNSVRSDTVFYSSFSSPRKIDISSIGPQLSAPSAIVVDKQSGAVLFSKDEFAEHSMASIVKLMTALVFLESEPNLEDRVVMLEEDDREGGEDFLRPEESAELFDVLVASLLGSANNATIVLSRNAGGMSQEEFVERMNEKAREIGMEDTVFVEPSGLSVENKSTARDIVKLLNEVSKNEIITEITGKHRDSIIVYPSGERRYVSTTNHLMGSIVFVEFGKTGYLDESLYNLATAVTIKNKYMLYIVTLGSETNKARVQDAKNLAVWAERTYEW